MILLFIIWHSFQVDTTAYLKLDFSSLILSENRILTGVLPYESINFVGVTIMPSSLEGGISVTFLLFWELFPDTQSSVYFQHQSSQNCSDQMMCWFFHLVELLLLLLLAHSYTVPPALWLPWLFVRVNVDVEISEHQSK